MVLSRLHKQWEMVHKCLFLEVWISFWLIVFSSIYYVLSRNIQHRSCPSRGVWHIWTWKGGALIREWRQGRHVQRLNSVGRNRSRIRFWRISGGHSWRQFYVGHAVANVDVGGGVAGDDVLNL